MQFSTRGNTARARPFTFLPRDRRSLSIMRSICLARGRKNENESAVVVKRGGLDNAEIVR